MIDRPKLPPILVLRSIRPEAAGGGRLVSPRIDRAVAGYDGHEDKIREFLARSRPGSLDEEGARRALDKLKLLEASQKLASPDPARRSRERDRWAGEFNEVSSRLYGRPRPEFIGRIVEFESAFFASSQGRYVEKTANFYRDLAGKTAAPETGTGRELLSLTPRQLADLEKAFKGMNDDWFGYLERNRQDKYGPADLVGLFNGLIELRCRRDGRWRGWKARLSNSRANVSVSSLKKTVYVGRSRSYATHKVAAGLVAHELGVHAERAVNGAGIDERLGRGYPGYLDIEESLGVLAEELATGEMPDKARDRYLDIALAMGLVPERVHSRQELTRLAQVRALARRVVRGQDLTRFHIETEAARAEAHTDRIFRGGDGLPGPPQAVFTKDAIYYPAELNDYIARAFARGRGAAEILDYLLLGKFDPTDELHRRALEKASGAVC